MGLHVHSEGSFLDGYSRVTDIVKRAKELGQSAVALTDHGEVNQHLAFQRACDAGGIKPLLGMEGYWIDNITAAREAKKYPSSLSHICLIAQSNRGLTNLWALASVAYDKNHFYHRPLADIDLLREYSEGVLASDGCMITELSRKIEAGDEDAARQILGQLLSVYGDRFYSELHTWCYVDPKNDEQRRLNTLMTQINQAKVRLATEMGIPLVVVNDAHHARPEDWYNKELVWQFSTHKNPDQQEDIGQKADHMMGDEELYFWMAKHGISSTVVDEAIKNSAIIANACNVEIKRTLDMPRLTQSDDDDLRMLLDSVERGFRAKVVAEGLPEEVYAQRLEEELTLISQKSFAGYFNVVKDYVDAAVTGEWAPYVKGTAHAPMLCGPGRGSAGGCLVAYLLGITSLDPIHYDLLFERFLAPGRKDWPDIDCDFPQSMRPDAKSYLETRYGHDHVCTIATLSRSKPKGILKDLGRALKIPLADIIKMSKIIEQVQAVETEVEEGEDEPSWEEVIEKKGGELADWARQYPLLFQKVNEMVGTVRQSGLHPSGVVVSNKPLLGTIPLRTKNSQMITQFDMYEVEELGAVKLDLLGLRHLDTLMHARDLVYDRHGVWLDFRDDRLPRNMWGDHPSSGYTDPPVFGPLRMPGKIQKFGYAEYADPAIWTQIHQGHTVGIFQLETPGLTRAAMELKPLNEKDVAALISIVRPGVKDAGLDKAYLARRAGDVPVEYDHPMMEPITKETYGVLIYQEQLLRTVKELASFTPDEADDLRKALGKKMMDRVVSFKDKFMDGCQRNNQYMDVYRDSSDLGVEASSRIWASIEASGRYLFNKSHAVGYAIIPTWEIWTKYYYPIEFQAALKATDGENINRYVRESRRLGIKILPPDINRSAQKFTIEGNDAVRYGIDALRGVGSAVSKDIQAHRPYNSLEDFLARAKRGANKTSVYNLICVGAFDSLGTREYHLGRLERQRAMEGLAQSTLDNPEKLETTVDRRLAENPEKYAIEVPDFSDERVVFQIENELVGTYITVDPMGQYLEAIDSVGISDPSEIDSFKVRTEFVVGGQVTRIKTIRVQREGRNKNREMAFLTVQHRELDYEITVFPDKWDETKLLLPEGVPVVLVVIRDDRGCHLKHVERLDLLRA